MFEEYLRFLPITRREPPIPRTDASIMSQTSNGWSTLSDRDKQKRKSKNKASKKARRRNRRR